MWPSWPRCGENSPPRGARLSRDSVSRHARKPGEILGTRSPSPEDPPSACQRVATAGQVWIARLSANTTLPWPSLSAPPLSIFAQERECVRQASDQTQGNQTRAARLLGLIRDESRKARLEFRGLSPTALRKISHSERFSVADRSGPSLTRRQDSRLHRSGTGMTLASALICFLWPRKQSLRARRAS